MAPSMKRPATATLESAKKRVKPVAVALADCEDWPGDMLSSCLEFSLGVFKELRSAHQSEVVESVGEALAAMEKGLQEEISEADGKTKNVHADKEARVKAEADAEGALDGLKSALAAAQGEEAKASEEAKAADAALKAAEDEQESGDAAINAVIAKKAKVEAVKADAYVPLKEQALTEAEIKKLTKKLVSLGKDFSFDSSLLESAPAALSKKMEDRSGFDNTILATMDTEMQKCLDGLAAEVTALEPAKNERAAKVATAKGAADAAAEVLQSKKDAVKAAKESLKAGEKSKKDASAHVKNWWSDIKALFDEAEAAKASLTEFVEGPLKVYKDLKEMETPPPPPEEEEEEEEAPAEAAPAATEETAPAEAAPAEAAPAEA